MDFDPDSLRQDIKARGEAAAAVVDAMLMTAEKEQSVLDAVMD